MIDRRLGVLAAATLLALIGCDSTTPEAGTEGDEQFAVGEEDPELGKATFEPTLEPDAKEDAISGQRGMPTSFDRSATAVWEVTNAWADATTPAARLAGVAWSADSGLTWDEKYSLWVESLKRIPTGGYYETFELRTPWGRTLPSPALECAEMLIFLRATFASWYNLPFVLEATDSNRQRLYLGHFGFRTASAKYPGSPDFKTAYKDYTHLAGRLGEVEWPKDDRLRDRKLGGSQDDFQPFLFEGARAGAYFDEIFLNKRVGYFMVYALSYFGSINLADPRNTYNIAPVAIRGGDGLIQRWQRRGIGHVYVVKNVTRHQANAFEAELVSGSMPRRQAKWETPASSKSSLTGAYSGSGQMSGEGVPYSRLGGGLKRWRSPVVINGQWTAVVLPNDREHFISTDDFEALGKRTEVLEEILREPDPEEMRASYRQRIEDARNHLRQYPASCAARKRREEAFDALYAFEQARGQDVAAVDLAERSIEDYVFPEMVYEKSKTCCWNASNAAMYEIVMAKAYADVEDHTASLCREPTPFMNRDGGYQVFADFAASIGRASEWKPWTEDEPCAQRDVRDDTQADHRWTPWCAVGHQLDL